MRDVTPPLDGIRVIDLTQVVSGAVTTMLMADFGAEVIKIEPPGGESYRVSGYPLATDAGKTNLNIMRFSRGKKSMLLDLKHAGGKEVLADLIRCGDVLVENFRPGTLTRLGFPPHEISRLNPRLVYATVSGYGHDDLYESPSRNHPAYAIVVEAMAGLTHLAGNADGPPAWMGFAMADIFAGSLALSGILLALRDREQTGTGRRVDIGMFDGALLMNDLPMATYSLVGEVMGRGGYSLQSPWGPFETTDGFVAIAVLTEKQWASLCEELDRPDLRDDDRLSSGRGRSAYNDTVIVPAITAWSSRRTRDDCVRALLARDVPAAPVNTAADLFDSPQVHAREMLLDVRDPVMGSVKLVGNPIKLDGHALPPVSSELAAAGEHTDEILCGLLGMPGEQVEALRREGVLGSPPTVPDRVSGRG